MRKTKEILIFGIIFIIITSLLMPVKAEGATFKSELSASKKTIKPGDTVEVTVSVKDIDMGENGINTLEGTISYDKDIFEQVKSSDIKSANNWSTTFNDEGEALDGKFFCATLSHGIKEETQMFTVTFKTKKDIEETVNTKIEFKDITSNDGTNLVNSGTKSVDIKIEVEKVNPPDDGNNTTDGNNTNNNINNGNNNTNNGNKNNINTGTNNGKNTTSQTNVDNTKSTSGLPKTGKTSFILLAMIVVIISLIVFGIKNKNMKGI